MAEIIFYIGLDDTDAPDGMCTTWLGAVLSRTIQKSGMNVLSARLVRLNPTIPYKTRGNAAISLMVRGDPEYAFEIACDLVSKYAVLSCPNTHPGIVVTDIKPPADLYWKAVTGHVTKEEALQVILEYGIHYREYKSGRGLIGAAAAVCSEFPDHTWELLAYRRSERLYLPREMNHDSFFLSEELTAPHTWDTCDADSMSPVCIPHTPDPVLYGIRGDSPFAVCYATTLISSERPGLFQIWKTNQGTDAHIIPGTGSALTEGVSYLIPGTVCEDPITGPGGHVSFEISDGESTVHCMAFEPTKKFRDVVRLLKKGDRILAMGSFLKQSLNLEKMYVCSAEPVHVVRAPVCKTCNKRMTSAGTGKGYKCRGCGSRTQEGESEFILRTIKPGWYEVPPGARRHLSRPLVRGIIPGDESYLPIIRRKGTDLKCR